MKFEDSMQKLNEIVNKLESGELSLDEAIKLYQEGIDLSLFCKKEVENAKLKISQYQELK